jgi:hypothetical protein
VSLDRVLRLLSLARGERGYFEKVSTVQEATGMKEKLPSIYPLAAATRSLFTTLYSEQMAEAS